HRTQLRLGSRLHEHFRRTADLQERVGRERLAQLDDVFKAAQVLRQLPRRFRHGPHHRTHPKRRQPERGIASPAWCHSFDISVANGCVSLMLCNTALMTTSSGTARIMPMMPQSRPQNASANKISSGLTPSLLPAIRGSTIIPITSWIEMS